MIVCFYCDFECQVIHNGFQSEPFQVRPVLFLHWWSWVTRQAYRAVSTGIQWTLTQKLEDLDFANDLCLISHKLEHIREKREAGSRVPQPGQQNFSSILGKPKKGESEWEMPALFSLGMKTSKDRTTSLTLVEVVSETVRTEGDIVARIRKEQQAFVFLDQFGEQELSTSRQS